MADVDALLDEAINSYAGSGINESHIVIGRDRVICVPEELKKIAVQLDHNIETVTFDCPRYWDEHDLSEMDIKITFQRPDGYEDLAIVKNVRVDETDTSLIHFDWTLSQLVTLSDGAITIAACARKDNAYGEMENHWSTELCTDLSVSKGFNCDDIIKNLHSDVVQAEIDELESLIIGIVSKTAVNVKIPKGLTSVSDHTFYRCTTLESLELPAGVTSIGESALYGCSNLTSINLPDEVTSIGSYAFINCTSLTSIKLPASLTSIPYGAFSGCSKLASVDFAEGLTNLDTQAFAGCSKLGSIKLPDSLTTIGSQAFAACTNLVLTELPAGVTSISDLAFAGCSKITSITFKGTPNSISYQAFVGCTGITTINVPWAKGAISGAPWGATNATINYNYVE